MLNKEKIVKRITKCKFPHNRTLMKLDIKYTEVSVRGIERIKRKKRR